MNEKKSIPTLGLAGTSVTKGPPEKNSRTFRQRPKMMGPGHRDGALGCGPSSRPRRRALAGETPAVSHRRYAVLAPSADILSDHGVRARASLRGATAAAVEGTGEPSGDGRAGKTSTDAGESSSRQQQGCADGKNVTPPHGRQRWTAGRWEKSPSQPCPSVCGGKPPVSLTVCLRKRR